MLAPGARRTASTGGRVGNSPTPSPKPVLGAPKIKIPSVAQSSSSPSPYGHRPASSSSGSRPASAGSAGAPPLQQRASARVGGSTVTSTMNTARSGSASARAATNTARSSSAMSTGSKVGGASTASTAKPFHRPVLSSAQRDAQPSRGRVPIRPIYDARADPLKRSASNTSTGGGGASARSGSVSNNEEQRHAAAARITRSPSPAKIMSKRCKHCSGLVQDLEKHTAECPCAPLECGLHDSEAGGTAPPAAVLPGGHQHPTVCNFVARGAKHLAEHRATQCPFRRVPCPNAEQGCAAQVSLQSVEKHCHETCSFSVYVCEFCKASVTRGAHEAHVSTECPQVRVLCPLGCGRDVPRCELESHIREQWSDAQHPRGQQQQQSNSKLPPESSRRVAETLIAVLDRQSQSLEAQTILAASDDLDACPLGGSAETLEHSLFVGQSVWRSIQRLSEWCGSSAGLSQAAKQQVFEILERRTESAKTRLAKHAGDSTVASTLKSTLDTSLGKVALKVCE